MRVRSRGALLTALAAAGTLAVAGCGGGEEPAEETAAGGTTQEETGGGEPVATVDVTEVDFEIRPADATVDEDGLIEFDIANEGQSPHALSIEADPEVESETIEPGQSTSFTAELDSGEYVWYCPVANHRELGMEGTVTVGGGSGAAGDGGGETESEAETDSETETESEGSDGSPAY